MTYTPPVRSRMSLNNKLIVGLIVLAAVVLATVAIIGVAVHVTPSASYRQGQDAVRNYPASVYSWISDGYPAYEYCNIGLMAANPEPASTSDFMAGCLDAIR
jgi:hypothetical protein